MSDPRHSTTTYRKASVKENVVKLHHDIYDTIEVKSLEDGGKELTFNFTLKTIVVTVEPEAASQLARLLTEAA